MAIPRPLMEILEDPLSLEKGLLARPRWWVSALVWVGGFMCMEWMQSSLQLGLAAVTVMLILTSALASLFVTPVMAVVFSIMATLAFNILFTPPVGVFQLKLNAHHELILLVALVISLVVGVLTSRLRMVGVALQQRMGQIRTLNDVSNTLNRSEDPSQVAQYIRSALASMVGGQIHLAIVPDELADAQDPLDNTKFPRWDDIPDQAQEAVNHSIRIQEPVPAGTAGMSLPLRGQQRTLGAALLTWRNAAERSRADLDAAQTLCNLFGMALERAQRTRKAATASKAAFRREHSNLVLSAVSHEYRTPLSTILSHASQMRMLGPQLAPEQQQRMLDTVLEEVEHLKRVTTNMLQLARLDAQAFSIQLEWESVEDLLGSVLHRFRARYPGWRPVAQLQPGLPLIRCDAVLLAQVFENLLDNARHYAGPAPATITAWADATTVHIAVMDRGPGIDTSLQSRLFQVFERGRALKTLAQDAAVDQRQRMGTGVGLALCRAILEAHGGDIAWRARDGGGSVFECWLPLPTEAAMDLPPSIIEEVETS